MNYTAYYICFYPCDLDFPVFRILRKQARVKKTYTKRGKFVQIVSIKPTESVAVKCIKVDSPSHLFLCGKSMTPTHNTIILLYLLAQSARLHNWRWLIVSTENSPGFIFKTLMEFSLGKAIKAMTKEESAKANKFVKDHFVIVKSDTIYTYTDILNMAEQVNKQQKIDGVFIDPYNAVDYDLKLLKQLGGHEYHYHVTSRFRAFCKQNDCCIYLNCHAVTEALRRVWTKDGCPDKTLFGHPMPPKKADVEGGGKFANRADDFVIIHRYTQHEDYYRITELHVVKVKETETGGRVTNLNAPVKIEMCPGNSGFIDIAAKINCVTKEIQGSPLSPVKRLYESKQEKETLFGEEDSPFLK